MEFRRRERITDRYETYQSTVDFDKRIVPGQYPVVEEPKEEAWDPDRRVIPV